MKLRQTSIAHVDTEKPWRHLGVSLGREDLQKFIAATEVTLGNGESTFSLV